LIGSGNGGSQRLVGSGNGNGGAKGSLLRAAVGEVGSVPGASAVAAVGATSSEAESLRAWVGIENAAGDVIGSDWNRLRAKNRSGVNSAKSSATSSLGMICVLSSSEAELENHCHSSRDLQPVIQGIVYGKSRHIGR
jgi:hypothetical protein